MSRPNSFAVRLIAVGLLLASAIAVAACREDYLDRRQGVTLTGGDAMAVNARVQTINPWPPTAHQSRAKTDGEYLRQVIKTHREGPPKKTFGQGARQGATTGGGP
ncbi:MAG: hypothetical protein AAFU50_04610 [Pseudomonadota bacterium]